MIVAKSGTGVEPAGADGGGIRELPVPNAETRAAMDEVRRMREDPSLGKAYTDVDLMMQELLS